MIFLDTNVFLRHLTASVDSASEHMRRAATAIFEAVERGEEEITTSEVVLHEVCFVLGEKAHYGLHPRPSLNISVQSSHLPDSSFRQATSGSICVLSKSSSPIRNSSSQTQ